jgi:hypothetical protein
VHASRRVPLRWASPCLVHVLFTAGGTGPRGAGDRTEASTCTFNHRWGASNFAWRGSILQWHLVARGACHIRERYAGPWSSRHNHKAPYGRGGTDLQLHRDVEQWPHSLDVSGPVDEVRSSATATRTAWVENLGEPASAQHELLIRVQETQPSWAHPDRSLR